jgi:hypothetical protein
MNQPPIPEGTFYNSKEYKAIYQTYFKGLTNQELALEFNQKVGICYLNFAIQGFMNALIDALNEREIDYTEIQTSAATSWACKIKIDEGKVIKLNQLK